MTRLVPPPELIVENAIGTLDYTDVAKDFIRIGDGIMGNMIRQGFIKPGDTVLDMGCGLGRLARPLTAFLTGEYHGVDIVESSIEWCRENYQDHPNFQFHHAQIFNTYYNPTASVSARDYRFPFGDETFDFIWSTSLFTHMLIDEVDNYIGQMARTMKRGAPSWNTYLILDSVSSELVKKLDGKTRWYLPHEIEGGRVRDPQSPEAQIALYEDRIRDIHTKHGLHIEDIRYGPWSGRTENVRAGGQDVIIARKM